jgi:uncharacterized iron-regulated membrane protein
MTRRALRRWFWLHKWASLICTAFLLMTCITGLPLIFRDEIGDWLDDGLPYAMVADGAPNLSLDRIAATARQMYPGQVIGTIFIDNDEPKIMVALAPSWAAYNADRNSAHWIKFDSHTGAVLKESHSFSGNGHSFLEIALSLHRNLFAGLSGEMFLALMAISFVVAIVSGVVVYAPFMRRLDFGTVRADRSPRLKWLDLHNLTGVVLMAWMMVVGITGVINELSTPLFGLWQLTNVNATLVPLRGKPVLADSELSSPQTAYDTVRANLPDMIATSVIFPGSPFGSPYHYLIWTKGKEPLTSRLFSPVLIDARSGAFVSTITMPWYLRALEVSRPLHFGDYGGLPLKIIWGLFDLTCIFILGSGLYLWLSRRPSRVPDAEAELLASRISAPAAISGEAAE